MSTFSTHVLDTSTGLPAEGLELVLEIQTSLGQWSKLAQAQTNSDGRAPDLLAAGTKLQAGIYRMTFETASYFKKRQVETFYPWVSVVFEMKEGIRHHHVPLLLSPYGFSTYRGS